MGLVLGANSSEVNSRPCLLPKPPALDSFKQLFSFSCSHSILHCTLYPRWRCLCSVISPGGFIRPYKFNTPTPIYRLHRNELPKCQSDLAQYQNRWPEPDGAQQHEVGQAGAAAELDRGDAHSRDTASLVIYGQPSKYRQASTQKSG